MTSTFSGRRGSSGCASDRDHIGQALAFRALLDVVHQVRLDLDGVYARFGMHARDSHREIAGSRTEVCDPRVGRKRERLDDFSGFLPRVARRVVEDACPFLGVVERMLMGMGRLGCGQ